MQEKGKRRCVVFFLSFYVNVYFCLFAVQLCALSPGPHLAVAVALAAVTVVAVRLAHEGGGGGGGGGGRGGPRVVRAALVRPGAEHLGAEATHKLQKQCTRLLLGFLLHFSSVQGYQVPLLVARALRALVAPVRRAQEVGLARPGGQAGGGGRIADRGEICQNRERNVAHFFNTVLVLTTSSQPDIHPLYCHSRGRKKNKFDTCGTQNMLTSLGNSNLTRSKWVTNLP